MIVNDSEKIAIIAGRTTMMVDGKGWLRRSEPERDWTWGGTLGGGEKRKYCRVRRVL